MLRDKGRVCTQRLQARAPATKNSFLAYCVSAGKGCHCHPQVPLGLEQLLVIHVKRSLPPSSGPEQPDLAASTPARPWLAAKICDETYLLTHLTMIVPRAMLCAANSIHHSPLSHNDPPGDISPPAIWLKSGCATGNKPAMPTSTLCSLQACNQSNNSHFLPSALIRGLNRQQLQHFWKC